MLSVTGRGWSANVQQNVHISTSARSFHPPILLFPHSQSLPAQLALHSGIIIPAGPPPPPAAPSSLIID